MRRVYFVLPTLLFCLCGLGAFAQQPTPNTDFLGLLQIGSRLKDRPTFSLAIDQNATLKARQQALNDPEVQTALRELRDWLAKPLQLPPSLTITALAQDFPAVSASRQLARALMIQQYVQLANGKVHEAIDTTRDTLRLAYAVQNHSMTGFLVGVAVERIAVSNLSSHLDQLSIFDCNALMKLGQDWASTNKIFEFALLRESAIGLESLKQALGQQKEALKEAEDALKAMYAQIIQMNSQAYWDRVPLLFEAKGEALKIGETLVTSLRPAALRLLDASTRRIALARMLSCHAAIRRHRWENRELPATLAALDLKEMSLDPFTGQEFHYKVKGSTFTLESAGAFDRDDTGNLDRSSRSPFSLSGTSNP